MSPGLLHRARWAYAGIGIVTGIVRVPCCHSPFLCPWPDHPRARIDTGVIRGMPTGLRWLR